MIILDTPPIPENSIKKEPSAELAPNQKDSDSLPEYKLLDQILSIYIDFTYYIYIYIYILLLFFFLECKKKVEKKVGRLWEAPPKVFYNKSKIKKLK